MRQVVYFLQYILYLSCMAGKVEMKKTKKKQYGYNLSIVVSIRNFLYAFLKALKNSQVFISYGNSFQICVFTPRLKSRRGIAMSMSVPPSVNFSVFLHYRSHFLMNHHDFYPSAKKPKGYCYEHACLLVC